MNPSTGQPDHSQQLIEHSPRSIGMAVRAAHVGAHNRIEAAGSAQQPQQQHEVRFIVSMIDAI